MKKLIPLISTIIGIPILLVLLSVPRETIDQFIQFISLIAARKIVSTMITVPIITIISGLGFKSSKVGVAIGIATSILVAIYS